MDSDFKVSTSVGMELCGDCALLNGPLILSPYRSIPYRGEHRGVFFSEAFSFISSSILQIILLKHESQRDMLKSFAGL